MTSDPSSRSPASPFSIASVVASMVFVAMGNGMMLAYVPIVLAKAGAPLWASGAALTAQSFGGLAGCLVAGPLIRRAGHARIFSVSMALVIFGALTIAAGINPLLWIFGRAVYGMAGNINFVISQSWINDAAANSWRGRAMSIFYMLYILGLGLGSWTFSLIPAEGNAGPLMTILFTTCALIPIGLTRLPNPPPPATIHIDIPRAWRVSPVGLIGVLAAGALTMTVQGFLPIYAASEHVEQSTITTIMFVMQLGLIFIQYPMGIVSDRIDRRLVLIATCLLIAAAGFCAFFTRFDALLVLMPIYAIWSGAVETVYSVSNAHANDQSKPEDFVSLSSTLLVAWSVTATLVPLGVTAVTPTFGPRTFIVTASAIALAYAAFVFYRVITRPLPTR